MSYFAIVVIEQSLHCFFARHLSLGPDVIRGNREEVKARELP
jgi:hypothetical protein